MEQLLLCSYLFSSRCYWSISLTLAHKAWTPAWSGTHMVRLDPDVMRAVGAVARVVVIARIPSDSLRSTWVEPGHARRLGRMESQTTGLFCPFSARPVRCLVMRARFPHGSVVDPCGNRSLLGWLCRTRLGEGQNRPSATIGNVKDSDWGRAQLEMSSPTCIMCMSSRYCIWPYLRDYLSALNTVKWGTVSPKRFCKM